MTLPICINCKVKREFVEIEHCTTTHEIGSYRCPVCKSILRLGQRRTLPPAPEKKCVAWNGTGVSSSRGASQPGRKIYPARCEKCRGKGRVKVGPSRSVPKEKP